MKKKFGLFIALLIIILAATPLMTLASGVTQKFCDGATYHVEFNIDDLLDELSDMIKIL